MILAGSAVAGSAVTCAASTRARFGSAGRDAVRIRATARLLPLVLLLHGCALSTVNQPLGRWTPSVDQPWLEAAAQDRSPDLAVILAFSGGGTRAAALSYGVLQELAATDVMIDGRKRRLLDEVDVVSGVSGGSFPAAYYGLHGDRIFEDFEPLFLRKDGEGALIARLFWPPNWVRLASQTFGRSDLAARYYDSELFHGATFRDLARPGAPIVVLNATDLATGSRFGFTQQYFDLLCSDLASYPVSHACAASSAVPFVLSPITLKSYDPACGYEAPDWLEAALQDSDDPRRRVEALNLRSYLNPERRRYAHLVDGGIADNLGLRAVIDTVTVHGDPERAFQLIGHPHPRAIVFILVNAATRPQAQFDLAAATPTLAELLNEVTSAQLENYDFDTIELLRSALGGWSKALSEPGRPVEFAFVDVSFDAVADEHERHFLNEIGTSFSLDDDQVDHLIATGRSVLRSSSDFRKAVRILSSPTDTAGTTARSNP